MSSWQHFAPAPAGSASPTGGVAAVSRIPNSMETWWIGQDGSVQAAFWYEGGQWTRYVLAGAGNASPRGGITAVSRIPNSMEVWWIGQDGSIQAAFWYEGGQWTRYQLAGAGSASLTGGIKAVSRIPNSMEMWWIGQDGSVQDGFWYDTAPFPSSQTWGPIPINFADGTALGGTCTIAMNNNGDWTFSGHLHDSGFDSYDFSVVAVVLTPSGIAYTMQHQGHTQGTSANPFGPNRDDNWTNSDNNPSIRNNWAQVVPAVWQVRVVSQDDLAAAVSDLLQQALQDLVKQGIKSGIEETIALIAAG